MYLQKYIKYLVCVIVVYFTIPQAGISTIEAQINDTKNARGIFDFVVGKIRGCECGRSNRHSARYIGGEPAATHEFPWLANIHVKRTIVVSGVLINDRYVLTAASQLIGATPSEIKVALGENDRCNVDVSSLNSTVEAIILHEGYSSKYHSHDIALIRLSRQLTFDKRISPVCLPNPNSKYLGQVGTVVGWAEGQAVDDIQPRTCLPRKVGLPILARDTCINSRIEASIFHEYSGCVGVLGSASNICVNDVGSPLLWRSYAGIYDLVGIIAYTNICDDKPRLVTFTQVGPHLSWILANTKEARYCTK